MGGMVCAYCGQPLERGARICRLCGMLVARNPDAAPVSHAALFPVAPHKFLILSACSLNLYLAYWSYQNWKRIRESSGESLSPLWRAFFAFIWIIPLLERVRQQADRSDVPVWWNARALGVCFIILSLLSRLHDPWWLIALGSSLALLPVVETSQQINGAAENPEGQNDRYTAGNVATIVIGGLFLIELVVATLSQA
jgi:hypothetical protein